MDELRKVVRVIGRRVPGAPHETLLVLDGTVGQNAVQQGKLFAQAVQPDRASSSPSSTAARAAAPWRRSGASSTSRSGSSASAKGSTICSRSTRSGSPPACWRRSQADLTDRCHASRALRAGRSASTRRSSSSRASASAGPSSSRGSASAPRRTFCGTSRTATSMPRPLPRSRSARGGAGGRLRRARRGQGRASRPGGDSGSSTPCCGTRAACSSASGPARRFSTAPSSSGRRCSCPGRCASITAGRWRRASSSSWPTPDGEADPLAGGKVLPVYPATEGLSHKVIRGLVDRHLDALIALSRGRPARAAPALARPPHAARRAPRGPPARDGGRGGAGPAAARVRRAARSAAHADPRPRRWPSGAGAAWPSTVRRDLTTRLREALPWELTDDQQPRAPRDHRRHDRARADAPAAHGRRRHRQDGRGAVRHAARGGERLPGGAHGARPSSWPSSTRRRSSSCSRRSRSGPSCCSAGRPRRRSRRFAGGSPRARRGSSSAPTRCMQESVVVPAARPRGDRRAAPLRGRAAGGADRQGRGTRRPAAHRHADPALAGAHALRRPRRLHPARSVRRAAARSAPPSAPAAQRDRVLEFVREAVPAGDARPTWCCR